MKNMKGLAVIILAAGKGVRMQSDLPKVFHKIAGEPMLSYVLKAVGKIAPEKCLAVVGHQRERIMDYYKDWPVEFAVQEEQLGTGHAVLQAEPLLQDFSGTVLILNGDVPLISERTLRRLIEFHQQGRAAATDLTAVLDEAGSYGRVVRSKDGKVERIVEKKDATPIELQIREINTGTFCFEKEALFAALKKVRAENAQKEYYLTDTLEIIKSMGLPVLACRAENPLETLGINSRDELSAAEKNLLNLSHQI